MSTETKLYDEYSILILGAKERAKKTLKSLIKRLPNPEDEHDLWKLYEGFLCNPSKSNKENIEEFFKNPDLLDSRTYSSHRKARNIESMRLLFLTINSLALVGYLCVAASQTKTQEDFQARVLLIWEVLAVAEFQHGEVLGLQRGYKIRHSDFSKVAKAIAQKMTEARHSPNRRAKNAAIARWLIKGAIEYGGNKTGFAEDELKILKDESPPIDVTERTIREDWLSPKSILQYEQEQQQTHE